MNSLNKSTPGAQAEATNFLLRLGAHDIPLDVSPRALYRFGAGGGDFSRLHHSTQAYACLIDLTWSMMPETVRSQLGTPEALTSYITPRDTALVERITLAAMELQRL